MRNRDNDQLSVTMPNADYMHVCSNPYNRPIISEHYSWVVRDQLSVAIRHGIEKTLALAYQAVDQACNDFLCPHFSIHGVSIFPNGVVMSPLASGIKSDVSRIPCSNTLATKETTHD